jgi:hypothetical protein
MGAGTGPNPAGTVTIGPVGLLGVVASKLLTLARLSDGVLWFKTYIVISNAKDSRVTLSVRSLSGGKVGLDWGTQQSSNPKPSLYTPLNSLKVTTLSMPLCDGTSAGFPGGFVMTKPLCAQVTATAGKVRRSERLSFGGATCQVDAAVTTTTAGNHMANSVAAALPVVRCPTQYAITTPVTKPTPSTLVVEVPANQESALSVYSDTDEIEMVLAPRGWKCQAGYGADGSGAISVYPREESTPRPFSKVKIRPNSTDEGITLLETGGSPVQAAFAACPYFTSAAALNRQDGLSNCTKLPVHSVVEPISQDAVDFAIAAGQTVSRVPSGGRDVTNGVVLYTAAAQPGTYEGTCTLPQSEHAVCTTTLNDMVDRYSGK